MPGLDHQNSHSKLGGADMTYRTQLWIMTVLYALTTAVIFYWVTLFMTMTS